MNQQTRIKICGLTNSSDIQFAADLGVDAIGLVFHAKSPRNVCIQQAQLLLAGTPAFLSTVALFRNASEAQVAAVANQLPVDYLQFHGDETPEFCQRFGKPYLKAIGMGDGMSLDELAEQLEQYSSARGILLDSHSKNKDGGSGETFNWENIPVELAPKIILAGGLTLNNVSDAIRQVKPYGVDISSGVESARGVKSQRLMKEFVEKVKQA